VQVRLVPESSASEVAIGTFSSCKSPGVDN
jgi:hypothetical protein